MPSSLILFVSARGLFPSERGSSASGTGQLTCARGVNLTCVKLLFCASMRVFSSKCEEDAKVICWHDELANHADGLRARVAKEVVFSLCLFEVVPSRNSGAKNDWVTRIFVIRKICHALRSQLPFGSSVSLVLLIRTSSNQAESVHSQSS